MRNKLIDGYLMPEHESRDFDMPSSADMMDKIDALYHSMDDDERIIHYHNLCVMWNLGLRLSIPNLRLFLFLSSGVLFCS